MLQYEYNYYRQIKLKKKNNRITLIDCALRLHYVRTMCVWILFFFSFIFRSVFHRRWKQTNSYDFLCFSFIFFSRRSKLGSRSLNCNFFLFDIFDFGALHRTKSNSLVHFHLLFISFIVSFFSSLYYLLWFIRIHNTQTVQIASHLYLSVTIYTDNGIEKRRQIKREK